MSKFWLWILLADSSAVNITMRMNKVEMMVRPVMFVDVFLEFRYYLAYRQ